MLVRGLLAHYMIYTEYPADRHRRDVCKRCWPDTKAVRGAVARRRIIVAMGCLHRIAGDPAKPAAGARRASTPISARVRHRYAVYRRCSSISA